MKKKHLSISILLVIINFSYSLFAGEFNSIKNFTSKDSISINNEIKVYTCTFLSNIDEERASKIEVYIMKNFQVVSCKTDIINKVITLKINTENNPSHFIFDVIKINFLDPIDKPVSKVIEHKD